MTLTSNAPEAREQVLSTLNRDGSRRLIRPKVSKGRYWRRRLAVGWSLIAIFTLLPILRMNGKPLVLLDVPAREFTLFGTTFLPTDTFLLMMLLFSIFVGIFLITAIWGRVWCGWACPQTVYMELLYRPLETLIEGGRSRQLEMDRDGPSPRRLLKYPTFFVVSAFLANTFLAYFVGWERLLDWITSPPTQQPAAFTLVLVVTLLMFLDFGWFREQTCIVACPYGRFQSVLLDRQSLIVGYDPSRGEQRAPLRADRPDEAGDCIDCHLCVSTCPTGIDIRDGLQMECIHCTQCMDACDAVMDKIRRPRGLIRYTSEAELESGRRRFLRPRVFVYTGLLVVMFGTLTVALAGKRSADLTLLRGLGAPYTELASSEIANQIRLKIANRSDSDRTYAFELLGAPEVELLAPENPLAVAAGRTETTAAFVNAPRDLFVDGELTVRLRVSDGVDFEEIRELRLVGPSGGGR